MLFLNFCQQIYMMKTNVLSLIWAEKTCFVFVGNIIMLRQVVPKQLSAVPRDGKIILTPKKNQTQQKLFSLNCRFFVHVYHVLEYDRNDYSIIF